MAASKLALGFSVHTGWAACVLVGGTRDALRVEARERVELLGDAARFVFHRAAELPPDRAARWIEQSTAEALAAAGAALGRFGAAARQAGGRLVGCGIVAKAGTPPASLAEIVASHPRIHASEGCFYRDALRRAAEIEGIPVRVVPPAAVEASASAATGADAERVQALLAAAGRAAGPPWGKDQKAAALTAWALLHARAARA